MGKREKIRVPSAKLHEVLLLAAVHRAGSHHPAPADEAPGREAQEADGVGADQPASEGTEGTEGTESPGRPYW